MEEESSEGSIPRMNLLYLKVLLFLTIVSGLFL
jgi:hypothetical protein